MRTLTLFCLALLTMVSCSDKKSHPYTFYYWKTRLTLNTDEKEALNQATAPYLYARFFDVDQAGGRIQPVGVITKDRSFATDKKLVPVVFITNRTFLHISRDEISLLAKNINHLVQAKTSEYHLNTAPEIQIDCDWTAGTRDDYFTFLKELKQLSGKTITCTLRLNQVKDKKQAGIPPVQKVYLMCYSTSSPLESSDKNSILDVNTLKNYLTDIDQYPVGNIDVALPIYSWGIVTNHLKKHRLINGLSQKDLNNRHFKKISENEAEIEQDGFYFGSYLSKGFRIKVEEISDEQLRDVVRFLNKKIHGFTIVYYQLDHQFIKGQNFSI